MPIEFIGIAATQEISESGSATPVSGRDGISPQSESGHASGPVVQPGYLRELARAHEESGFDRVLVAHERLWTEIARTTGAACGLVRAEAERGGTAEPAGEAVVPV
ncbi:MULTISPECIES: hypothetical protein [unclassified Streptomyces]|uniref:hypothetical protein n=1 Tax=unclassified Streptomyces TaxID=2593676 RepID=UPI00081F59E3|nr:MULTISPECIES: hypothetical protein [unclassified Streptomyces]SCG07286.1 hypothetical protein GA0115259_111212 [Streptomyces sp. MnatMP-M17]